MRIAEIQIRTQVIQIKNSVCLDLGRDLRGPSLFRCGESTALGMEDRCSRLIDAGKQGPGERLARIDEGPSSDGLP
jgi:hypothetical protein